jgi:uncharacterized protein
MIHMQLGILSDTHDQADMMESAVQVLQGRGAQFFIHCGDIGSPRILDYLAELPAAVVWGNCDWDRPALQKHSESLQIQFMGAFGEIELAGQKIAVLHGDDARLKHQILHDQRHDYLLQGHTHVCMDERIGKTRLINPGALHRANPRTVALLDLRTNSLEFIKIPGGAAYAPVCSQR